MCIVVTQSFLPTFQGLFSLNINFIVSFVPDIILFIIIIFYVNVYASLATNAVLVPKHSFFTLNRLHPERPKTKKIKCQKILKSPKPHIVSLERYWIFPMIQWQVWVIFQFLCIRVELWAQVLNVNAASWSQILITFVTSVATEGASNHQYRLFVKMQNTSSDFMIIRLLVLSNVFLSYKKLDRCNHAFEWNVLMFCAICSSSILCC